MAGSRLIRTFDTAGQSGLHHPHKESKTMTTGRPTGAHWRTAATIVATAAIILSAFGFGTTAGASEFQPKPTASVTETCEGGAAFQVHLGNVEGLAPADFGITIIDESDGIGIPDHHDEQLVA